jgi:succinate dehydrogenase / fumarate reductase flavoprotein subunit
VITDRYGNLFDMYENITGENPYQTPMRIYPASHYTMGGLWVDYNLESTIPGLFVIGEANYSDHGANRLGASALMQGLADGYFVLPYTIGNYLGSVKLDPVAPTNSAFVEVRQEVDDRVNRLLSIEGRRTPTEFHRELGKLVWDNCGMARNATDLKKALDAIPALRQEFWEDLRVPGSADDFNQNLELAGRVADFFEVAELMCLDALDRNESCGAHYREEYQTPEGEAQRNDEEYTYVAAWQYAGEDRAPILNKEHLDFENVELTQRSYK